MAAQWPLVQQADQDQSIDHIDGNKIVPSAPFNNNNQDVVFVVTNDVDGDLYLCPRFLRI